MYSSNGVGQKWSLREQQHKRDTLTKTSHPEPHEAVYKYGENPDWNSKRHEFVKKAVVPNPVKI